jgi:hypothetical protein
VPTRPSPTPADTARALGTTLATASPLLALLATGAAYAPCADRDLLARGAIALEPAAGSGAPAATFVAHALSFLPLGASPLRAALASSALGAAAALALYRAIDAAAAAAPRAAAAYVRGPLMLAAVWLAFACAPLFLREGQAYAGGLALACLCAERMARAHAADSLATASRARRSAACWFALLLVEQPAIAVCVAVAAGSWARGAPGRERERERTSHAYALGAAIAVLAAIGAVLLYAREPSRAQSAAAAWLSGWTRSFQLAHGAFTARVSELSPAAWTLIAAAAIFGARAARGARPPLVHGWALLTFTALGGSALLAHPAPLQALALCGAAATCALCAAEWLGGKLPRRLAFAAGVLALALAAAQLRATALAALGDDGRAADVLREPLLRALPSRALVLVEPDLSRALHGAELEEAVRPDVIVARKPWRLDLAQSAALARSAPDLQPAMRAHLLQGALPVDELRSLAARRPLLIETMPGADERALVHALLPFGLYQQVSTSAATRSDARFAARDAEARMERWSALLDADAPAAECRALLRDRALAAAAYYEQIGDREHAAAARSTAGTFAP